MKRNMSTRTVSSAVDLPDLVPANLYTVKDSRRKTNTTDFPIGVQSVQNTYLDISFPADSLNVIEKVNGRDELFQTEKEMFNVLHNTQLNQAISDRVRNREARIPLMFNAKDESIALSYEFMHVRFVGVLKSNIKPEDFESQVYNFLIISNALFCDKRNYVCQRTFADILWLSDVLVKDDMLECVPILPNKSQFRSLLHKLSRLLRNIFSHEEEREETVGTSWARGQVLKTYIQSILRYPGALGKLPLRLMLFTDIPLSEIKLFLTNQYFRSYKINMNHVRCDECPVPLSREQVNQYSVLRHEQNAQYGIDVSDNVHTIPDVFFKYQDYRASVDKTSEKKNKSQNASKKENSSKPDTQKDDGLSTDSTNECDEMNFATTPKTSVKPHPQDWAKIIELALNGRDVDPIKSLRNRPPSNVTGDQNAFCSSTFLQEMEGVGECLLSVNNEGQNEDESCIKDHVTDDLRRNRKGASAMKAKSLSNSFVANRRGETGAENILAKTFTSVHFLGLSSNSPSSVTATPTPFSHLELRRGMSELSKPKPLRQVVMEKQIIRKLSSASTSSSTCYLSPSISKANTRQNKPPEVVDRSGSHRRGSAIPTSLTSQHLEQVMVGSRQGDNIRDNNDKISIGGAESLNSVRFMMGGSSPVTSTTTGEHPCTSSSQSRSSAHAEADDDVFYTIGSLSVHSPVTKRDDENEESGSSLSDTPTTNEQNALCWPESDAVRIARGSIIDGLVASSRLHGVKELSEENLDAIEVVDET